MRRIIFSTSNPEDYKDDDFPDCRGYDTKDKEDRQYYDDSMFYGEYDEEDEEENEEYDELYRRRGD